MDDRIEEDYRIEDLRGRRLLILDHEGPVLARVQDILDLIGEALPRGVRVIVVPVSRFDPAFFQLRSGLAGEFIQKIVNYRLQLAVIGDISEFTAGSAAFADFVHESNRGRDVLFLPDLDALVKKISAHEGGAGL